MQGDVETAERAVADEDFSGPFVIRELRLVFSSTPLSVRRALRSTLGGLAGLNLTRAECETVETVLAEVLNNVVEHAYDCVRDGCIEFRIRHDDRGLLCRVLDDGRPMPEGALPTGGDAWSSALIRDLPEGGFGWLIIRELATDIDYVRRGGRNCLSFRLPVGRTFRGS